MKTNNVLVLTYWDVNSALIQTYTLPYVRQIQKCLNAGDRIFLFTLSSSSPSANGIHQSLENENITLINFRYRPFGLVMVFKMCIIIPYLIFFTVRNKITNIHAWCTPAGALGYIISAVSGRRLILDSFEPHAETMVETGTWRTGGFAYRLLFLLEKRQLERACEVICATNGMIGYSQKVYKVRKNRYFVKPAGVDLKLFDPDKVPRDNTIRAGLKKVTCVYAGKFGGIYLEREVFDFFKTAYDYWNGDFSLVLLTSHSDSEIIEYCDQSGFPYSSVIQKFVSHHEVPFYLKLGDFGICPVKPLPSKRYCSPIKNAEYWAMGLPVVITSGISTDSDLIAENGFGYVLKSLTHDEYLNAVKKIDTLIKDGTLKKTIRTVAGLPRNFSCAEQVYRTIYGGNFLY